VRLISCTSCLLSFKDLYYKATKCFGVWQFLAKCEKSPHLWHFVSFLGLALYFSTYVIRSLIFVVFALTRFVFWSGSIELIILCFLLYMVYLRQRLWTNRGLMMIFQEKFIMFLCLGNCFNKLWIVLVFFSPVLLLQYSISRKHGRECFLYLVYIRWLFLT
jgi:uncharacterized membrane protein